MIPADLTPLKKALEAAPQPPLESWPCNSVLEAGNQLHALEAILDAFPALLAEVERLRAACTVEGEGLTPGQLAKFAARFQHIDPTTTSIRRGDIEILLAEIEFLRADRRALRLILHDATLDAHSQMEAGASQERQAVLALIEERYAAINRLLEQQHRVVGGTSIDARGGVARVDLLSELRKAIEARASWEPRPAPDEVEAENARLREEVAQLRAELAEDNANALTSTAPEQMELTSMQSVSAQMEAEMHRQMDERLLEERPSNPFTPNQARALRERFEDRYRGPVAVDPRVLIRPEAVVPPEEGQQIGTLAGYPVVMTDRLPSMFIVHWSVGNGHAVCGPAMVEERFASAPAQVTCPACREWLEGHAEGESE